jgi:hypothetical protein
VEVVKFIQGDLERLYMAGIEGEYFQEAGRARVLLNVLFVWAEEHPHTSGYRQGMHEIAAPVLLALEAEASLWSGALLDRSSQDSSAGGPDSALEPYCSDEKYLESSLYCLFERIMQDLDYLYMPPAQGGELPGVVVFCTQVQEEMLRALDPALCLHLEDNYVQAQLYGMRWSRLLLGREFEAVEDSLFRIWDYIFASSLAVPVTDMKSLEKGQIKPAAIARLNVPQCEVNSNSDPLFNTPPSPVSSPDCKEKEVAVVDECMTSSAVMKAKRKARFDKPSPILESLADFMLAMLLHIRDDLLNGDNSTTLQLLMRYPHVDDVTPIIDLADMIRRGVLDSNSHVGGADDHLYAEEGSTGGSEGEGGGEGEDGKSHTPTWLWKESASTSDHGNDSTFSIRKNLQGVTKKMGKKISSAVSTSVSAFVHHDGTTSGGSGSGGDGPAPAKRKPSFGTRNSLFGISARGGSSSSSSKVNSLFGDPLGHENSPQEEGEGGESMIFIDKLAIEEDKSTVLVTEELIHLATCLEHWTADEARPAPDEFMPEVISRLRQLSGLLDLSVSRPEYTDVNSDATLNYKRAPITDEAHSQQDAVEEVTCTPQEEALVESESNLFPSENKKKDEQIFGTDFFASTFGLKTEAEDSDHNSSELFKSVVKDDKIKKKPKKIGGTYIEDIFSDLTGETNVRDKPDPFA